MEPHPPKLNWRYFKANPSGTSPVQKEMDALGVDAKATLKELMGRRARNQLMPDENKPLGDGLWELRKALDGRQYRLVYAPLGSGLVLLALTAFEKKSPRTPKPVIKLAKKRRKVWLAGGS
jgi:phage-related protein